MLANGYDNKTKVPQIYVLSLIDDSNCDVVTEDAAVPEHGLMGFESTTH